MNWKFWKSKPVESKADFPPSRKLTDDEIRHYQLLQNSTPEQRLASWARDNANRLRPMNDDELREYNRIRGSGVSINSIFSGIL